VMTVERIAERFLDVAIALDLFPFSILGFHSDNGSEYINETVAELLRKLLIEQTKSRARRSNDNGLVETKNGSVVRKLFGYSHIPQHAAHIMDAFNREHLDTYLNYHRPCGFATVTIDRRGKEKKKYDVYLTPFEKLKSLDNWAQFLVPGVTPESLEKNANTMSDTECAALKEKGRHSCSTTLKN
jgi:transposase InsO family protein